MEEVNILEEVLSKQTISNDIITSEEVNITEDALNKQTISNDISTKEMSNLILFAASKFVSLLGTNIFSFAISLYILKVTGSGTSFALSILISSLPRVLLGPIAGSISDRVDRKKMIVGLDFLSGVVLLILLFLSYLFGLQIPFIYSATFLLAIINTFFNICLSAGIPKLVTDRKLVKINSYNSAIESGSSILGPVLAGMIFSFVSMDILILVNGIAFILAAISEVFIDFNLNKSQRGDISTDTFSIKTIGRDIKEVYSFIRSNQLLSLIIPFSVSFNFLLSASLSVVLPFLIINVIGMTSSQYGFIEGAFAAGMFIAAIVVGKLPEKEKKRKGLVIGTIGMGLTVIIMGIPSIKILQINHIISFTTFILVALLFAYFTLSINIPLLVTAQRCIPDYMLGRVMGLIGAITNGLVPLGIILAGVSLDIIPAYIIFFVTGIYFLAAAFYMSRCNALKEY
jgi:MFS transporter, DHA3 family, macrolide efflux protein